MTETLFLMANPSTMLSMDSSSHEEYIPPKQPLICRPPDINLPLSAEVSPTISWANEASGLLGSMGHETEELLNLSKVAKKCSREDSVWGAWFFFNHYFKPALVEKSKSKLTRDGSSACVFEKSDLRLDLFIVQHDMENIYMWMFKERPLNALGKMQLRSYMNGHGRLGDPQFPFSPDKGFVRSHRMQRKHYRGLSNPQCVHGIEIVRLPNLSNVSESDLKRWSELTGRDSDISISVDAESFSAWRNLPTIDFELDRMALKLPSATTADNNNNSLKNNPSKICPNGGGINGSGLNELSNGIYNKRRKEFLTLDDDNINDTECCLPMGVSCVNGSRDHEEVQQIELLPHWSHDFSGVMRHAFGPVTAAKTVYEDEKGYLIMVSLPFTDIQRVRVSWRNTVSHGIVKVHFISSASSPFVKRGDRSFKLCDAFPEHCPPGEFVREIALATMIPENAELEAYYVEACAGLEIMVPKHSVFSEEREVRVFLRPQLDPNE
eukprot:Gb_28998 [translate_table: standard]